MTFRGHYKAYAALQQKLVMFDLERVFCQICRMTKQHYKGSP